jgi:hypothetical protein
MTWSSLRTSVSETYSPTCYAQFPLRLAQRAIIDDLAYIFRIFLSPRERT